MDTIIDPAIVAEMRAPTVGGIKLSRWSKPNTGVRFNPTGDTIAVNTPCWRYFVPPQQAIDPGPPPAAPPPNPLPARGRGRPSAAHLQQQEQHDRDLTAHRAAKEVHRAALEAHAARVEQYEQNQSIPGAQLTDPYPELIFTHGINSTFDNPSLNAFVRGFTRYDCVLGFEKEPEYPDITSRVNTFRLLMQSYPTATAVGGRSLAHSVLPVLRRTIRSRG
jgi:hypothetical protein